MDKKKREGYDRKFNKSMVESVSMCLHCGAQPEKTWIPQQNRFQSNLVAHHLDGDKTNNDISNITVLCRKCHSTIGHKYVFRLLKNGKSIIDHVELNDKSNLLPITSLINGELLEV